MTYKYEDTRDYWILHESIFKTEDMDITAGHFGIMYGDSNIPGQLDRAIYLFVEAGWDGINRTFNLILKLNKEQIDDLDDILGQYDPDY